MNELKADSYSHPLFESVVWKSKEIEKSPEGVLSIQTGINQVSLLRIPLRKAAIVERLFTVPNKEGHHIGTQAFLQCNQPAHYGDCVSGTKSPASHPQVTRKFAAINL